MAIDRISAGEYSRHHPRMRCLRKHGIPTGKYHVKTLNLTELGIDRLISPRLEIGLPSFSLCPEFGHSTCEVVESNTSKKN